jgi:hypothetical protein
MLIEPMIQQLHTLRLRGMAAALEQLLASAQSGEHQAARWIDLEDFAAISSRPSSETICHGAPACHLLSRK